MTKDAHIRLRVSTADKKQYEAKARAVGLTLSSWVVLKLKDITLTKVA